MARRKDDNVIQFFIDVFMRVHPVWSIPIACLAYVVVNLVIRFAAGSTPLTKGFLEWGPMLGGLAAFFVLIGGGVAAIKRTQRRQLFDNQTSIDSIRKLSWSKFEQLIGEAFRRQGYEVSENSRGGADGGVDLRLKKEGKTTVVQCKQWKAYKVSVQTVRELFGVMMADGASQCILVTSGVFTAEARDWASGKAIGLIDGDGLRKLIGHIPPAQPSAQSSGLAQSMTNVCCPKCRKPMALRTAKRGTNAGSQFWGCTSYPACNGTRKV